jgi:hypothetical protein
MSKFKVGDKVRILDGSKIEKYSGGWNKEYMSRHIGEIYKVKAAHEHWGDSPYTAYTLNMRGITRNAKWDERGLELVIDQKFKVGDKVRAKKDAPYGITTDGWTGKVVSVHKDSIKVFGEGVIDPKDVGSGFYVNPDYFELIPDQKIVITTDGKTTTAVFYDGKQRIKEAKVVCAPSDEFNFKYGASLALSRLNDDKISVDEFPKKSQMDRFIINDEISLEIPQTKTMEFLRECERIGLRWVSGQKATEFGNTKKYFRVLFNHLTYSDERTSNKSREILDGTKAIKNVEDKLGDEVFDAIKAMAVLLKLMKDGFDD